MLVFMLLYLFHSPCRDKVRQEHEEIVATLNQRMAEKARYGTLVYTSLTLWPPGRLLTALSIFPRSAFGGFYLQISLSHGYLLRIRINQMREVSIVYCQWVVIARSRPASQPFARTVRSYAYTAYLSIESSSVKAVLS